MSDCIRCRVYGRVQGVWFRAATQQQAQQLGVTGSATNMPDGSVEVIACGEGALLQQLQRWLWQGPPHAQVARVDCQALDAVVTAGFTTG